MVKILHFLTISMLVVGLSKIAKCVPLEENNTNTTAKEDNKNTDNAVKHYETCYYPHRCNKRHYCGEPLYCDYAVYVGKRQQGDRLFWRRTYANPRPKNKTSSVIHVVYPSTTKNADLKKGFPITYILVEDNNKSNSIFNDTVSIVTGGIGETFVSLNITSYNPDRYVKYKVIIYAKNQKSTDN